MSTVPTGITQHPTDPWTHFHRVAEPALLLAPTTFLDDLQADLAASGIARAVAAHDTGALYDWIMGLVPLQAISDRAAARYAAQHGGVSYVEVAAGLQGPRLYPRLASYWHFEGCGYRKAEYACAESDHLVACPLPGLPLRKGSLNQAAYNLALFLRDFCGGDLIRWIDRRLKEADPGPGAHDRGPRLREAVLAPLCAVNGIGPKLWGMILADLLLGADLGRARWVTVGA